LHSLAIDTDLRDKQTKLVDQFSGTLNMQSQTVCMQRVKLEHFSITDGKMTIEFGNGTVKENKVLVHCQIDNSKRWKIVKQFEFTPAVAERMKKVCGATSFSLSLRNSEHLARYIHCGSWLSLQMVGEGPLGKALKTGMSSANVAKVNSPPIELTDATDGCAEAQSASELAPIYPEWKSFTEIRFKRPIKVLGRDDAEAKNIVFLGPSGAGKSRLINLLHNGVICKSAASAHSVTRHMAIHESSYLWISSKHYQQARRNRRAIHFIDSIGFCDSVLPPSEVLNLVKSYIKANVVFVDKVVFVCDGRIGAEQAAAMKNFMAWLKYKDNKQSFVFVYNKVENHSEDERLRCISQMCEILGVDSSFTTYVEDESGANHLVEYAIATGFPPGAPLSAVVKDLDALEKSVMTFRKDTKRIPVDESFCSIL
jgi:GTP-binding protein EngB required for normal cell division